VGERWKKLGRWRVGEMWRKKDGMHQRDNRKRKLSIMKEFGNKKYKDPVPGGATCGDVDDANRQANRLGGIYPVGECLLGVR
jgi:hypothetical protein